MGQLADQLRAAGAEVSRVGFNAGDRWFWGRRTGYVPFTDTLDAWEDRLNHLIDERGITELVLYGDARAIHQIAIEVAQARGLTLHVLEEGYLRPYWVTYERGGANGRSPLMQMSAADISTRIARDPATYVEAPISWGTLREHLFYGALYHFQVLVRNRPYRKLAPHRDISVWREFSLYLRRLSLLGWSWAQNRQQFRQVTQGKFPFHVIMLQLEHDASFQTHSDLQGQEDFINRVTRAFAAGAPQHHHLVFKDHPLEDSRTPIGPLVAEATYRAGLEGRVHHLKGGKLGPLLDAARTVVTVNSTAGQQALWRGLPLKALGRAVYSKPEFVSNQPLHRFFAQPARPDIDLYRDFRQFLLETSQLPGSFYSARGRRQVLRRLVDMMLCAEDPYQAHGHGARDAALAQHLHQL